MKLFKRQPKVPTPSNPWLEKPEYTQKVIDRNARALELEKSGNISQAVSLFEQSVSEQFHGSLPYDRLRIIYSRQKKYDDAIRICQAYIDNPYILGEGKTSGKQSFGEWIKKLEKKKSLK